MNVIIKKQGEGKTTDLILRSFETGYPIVTSSANRTEYIRALACKKDLIIPEPLSIYEIVNHRKQLNTDKVLIDEGFDVLRAVILRDIDSITLPEEELTNEY